MGRCCCLTRDLHILVQNAPTRLLTRTYLNTCALLPVLPASMTTAWRHTTPPCSHDSSSSSSTAATQQWSALVSSWSKQLLTQPTAAIPLRIQNVRHWPHGPNCMQPCRHSSATAATTLPSALHRAPERYSCRLHTCVQQHSASSTSTGRQPLGCCCMCLKTAGYDMLLSYGYGQ